MVPKTFWDLLAFFVPMEAKNQMFMGEEEREDDEEGDQRSWK